MGFNVNNLPDFKDQSGEIIAKGLLGAISPSLFNTHVGIKSVKTINVADMSITPVDKACGWNSAGDTTYTQIDLAVDKKQIQESYCIADIEDKYLQMYLKPGQDDSLQEGDSFWAQIVEQKAKQIGRFVEGKIYEATTVGGDAYEGLLFLTNSANTPAINTAATGVVPSKTTIMGIVDDLVSSLPGEAQVREDLVVIMSAGSFSAYKQAYRELNGAWNTNEGNFSAGLVLTHPGFPNVKVTMTTAAVGERVMLFSAEYVHFGTDLLSDIDNTEVFFSRDNSEFRLKGAFAYGVNISFADYHASNDR
jgi:hypothetical protein